MEQKIRHFLISSALVLGLLVGTACSSPGTEVGNPSGTRRNVTGALTSSSTLPALVNSLAFAVSNSCPLANGDVSVILRDPNGDTVTVAVNDDGSFEAEIDQDQSYEVLFEQNGAECGHLTNVATNLQGGLRVTLGRGTDNIILGTLTDRGEGIIETAADPGQFCDNDDDGITDDLDDDDDGNGVVDNDEDFDGYIDWFDTDDDGDGFGDSEDEGNDSSGQSACEISFVYPSSASGFELDGEGEGEIVVYVDSAISSVFTEEISLLNADESQLAVSFSETEIETSDGTLVLRAILDFATSYVLNIPAGAIVCRTGESNQNSVSIDFFTFEEE